MPNNIILTGPPGCGKSRLIRSLIDGIEPKVGIVEREILLGQANSSQRVGFLMMNHAGIPAILAHKEKPTAITIPSSNGAPYYVQSQALDTMVSTVEQFSPESLLFLDEIGIMEATSLRYQALVRAYLDAPNYTLATLGVQDHPFLNEIRERPDVRIIPINRDNSSRIYTHLRPKVKDAVKH